MSLAFVFPGQGSQSVGMMSGLAKVSPVVAATFAEASEVLGLDLWQRCQEGPPEALNATECTQPAMLTAGVATYRLWRERGGAVPAAMAGHSLGESRRWWPRVASTSGWPSTSSGFEPKRCRPRCRKAR